MSILVGGAKSGKGDTNEGGGSRMDFAEERSLCKLGTGSLRLDTPSRSPGREGRGGGLGVNVCEVAIGI